MAEIDTTRLYASAFTGEQHDEMLARFATKQFDADVASARQNAATAVRSATEAQRSQNQAAESAAAAARGAELALQRGVASGTYADKSKSYAVGDTGTRTGENRDNAKFYSQEAAAAANRAQGYAESMTVPAARDVYNVVLEDRVTHEKYALIVENGVIGLLGVSAAVNATDMTVIDMTTAIAYQIIVENGVIKTLEV